MSAQAADQRESDMPERYGRVEASGKVGQDL
jgi:hypothetical protein